MVDFKQFLFFFKFSKGSASARERRDAKDEGGSPPLPYRAFHHARSHFRVSRVSLDRLREKRDCSRLVPSRFSVCAVIYGKDLRVTNCLSIFLCENEKVATGYESETARSLPRLRWWRGSTVLTKEE